MILALQTAGPTTHLALYENAAATEPMGTDTWESGRELAAGLLGRLESFLKGHDATFTDLTGLIIFSGPGSFTSLRIGHTVANALADSLSIPIAGATGEVWATTALHVLATYPTTAPVLPHYGAEANITAPARPSSPPKT